MATLYMKHVTVSGPVSLHTAVLETLQEAGVMEVQQERRGVLPEDQERTKLLRLLEAVNAYREKDVAVQAPTEIPTDLIDFAREQVETHGALAQELRRLRKQLRNETVWRDTSTEQVHTITEGGVHLQCWKARDKQALSELEGLNAEVVMLHQQRRSVVFCTVTVGAPLSLSLSEEQRLPSRSPKELTDEIQGALERQRATEGLISWLARERFDDFSAAVAARHDELERAAMLARTHADEHVFALSGWVPERNLPELVREVQSHGAVALLARDPEPDEEPPSLFEYPKWAQPIEGLFEALGLTSGYREYDAGALMMVFLTIFSAILINDGGYGLILLTLILWRYQSLKAKLGDKLVRLGVYLAGATTLLGMATGSILGFQFRSVGSLELLHLTQEDFIFWAFTLGIIQLTLARLIRIGMIGVRFTVFGQVGWLSILWAAYLAVVNQFLGQPIPAMTLPLLLLGSALVIVFSQAHRGLGKAQVFGFLELLQDATTSVADVLSYMRLMIIAVMSVSMAVAINELAQGVDSWVGAGLIFLVGHSINLLLGLLAIMIHALRLNTLEFAKGLGVMWAGRLFKPFTQLDLKR